MRQQIQTINYQIAVTYKCNLKCKYCIELFDLLPCMGEESEVSLPDIRAAGKLLTKYDIQCGKLRITGGEPTLHGDIQGVYREAAKAFKPAGWTRTYTSGLESKPRGVHLAVKGPNAKKFTHRPILVSPIDMGVEPLTGFVNPCNQQVACGRYFDAYGFTACSMAAPWGRLFGVDYHYWAPVLMGNPDLCRHCIYSLGKRWDWKVTRLVRAGKIEYPSKTYREAIERRRDEGYVPIAKFRDKLPEHLAKSLYKGT